MRLKRSFWWSKDNSDHISLVRLSACNAECPFNFRFVVDGDQALAYLEGNGRYANRSEHPLPDLVILDLNMPGQDGFEVLRWIQTRIQFENLQQANWPDARERTFFAETG